MDQETFDNLDELPTKVYQFVNGIRSVPEIAVKILGEGDHSKVGSKGFYKVCDAVDELIDEGLVYMNDNGVLLDLMR